MRIEIVAPDDLVESIVYAIAHSAWTGRAGDAKIFVADVAEALPPIPLKAR